MIDEPMNPKDTNPNGPFDGPPEGGLLIELFQNPRSAETAFKDLLSMGYRREEITVMMSEETAKTCFRSEEIYVTDPGTEGLEGVGVGGAIGGAMGAVAAGIAAIGTSLIIPPLGIVVDGALAAAFAGGGAGALAGGLVGGLIGLGISDEQAKEFESGINAGGVVIGVETVSPENYRTIRNHWETIHKTGYAE